VRVMPVGELLFAHDREDKPPKRAHVVGIGSATRTLAALTVRRDGDRVLDLGTGCGFQALLAARQAGSVVATDLNPRAGWMTATNVTLNDVGPIDIRIGDLFEPVREEVFDLIVSNPPFVVSPDRSFYFRDASAGGDKICRDVVRGATAHLAPDGFATILVNWVVHAGEQDASAPRSWLESLPCDAWVLHHETLDPIRYADRWILPLERPGRRVEQVLERWLTYYERIGALGIASGAIILRRRDGPGWQRVDAMRYPPSGSASAQIQRVFEAQGAFAWPDDPRILAARFRLVDGHRLDQHLTYSDGRYEAHDARLVLEDGAGVIAQVPANALELVFALDGSRPLGAILADLSSLSGEDQDALTRRMLPVVRELFERGYTSLQGEMP
jgi:methylase of polypeptide subunit release factors